FNRGPSAASAARNALLSLEERVDGPVLDDIRLLVSELVTNAIRHAGAAAAIECRLLGSGAFEVAVTDHGDGVPAPVSPYEGDTRGHGLRIVDSLSNTWGVRPEGTGGKTVWARVDPPPPPS
ncbi:MAG TPA: ATP-binding protein, partial [Iamia sp.]|nr:ATP-binding protein [Iamia sp.]